MDEKQVILPEATEQLKKINQLLAVYIKDFDINEFNTEEQCIIGNSMMRLAEAFYRDDPLWAVTLADYIYVMYNADRRKKEYLKNR